MKTKALAEYFSPNHKGFLSGAWKYVKLSEFGLSNKYYHLKISEQTNVLSQENLIERFLTKNKQDVGSTYVETVEIYYAGLNKCVKLRLDRATTLELMLRQRAVYVHDSEIISGVLNPGPFQAYSHVVCGGYVCRFTNNVIICPSMLCERDTGEPSGYILVTILVRAPCRQIHGIIYIDYLDTCIRVRNIEKCFNNLWTNPNYEFNWFNIMR